MIIDTKAKYDELYKKRGDKQKKHWARSYMKSVTSCTIGDGSKPNHQERAVSIADCFPIIGRRTVVAPTYPLEVVEKVSK